MNSTTTDRTQRGRILGVLLAARGGEVGLRQILDLRISQFGTRIKELRDMGFVIVNRQQVVGEERRSWYRLVSGPHSPSVPTPIAPAASLFPDLTEMRHRDDG